MVKLSKADQSFASWYKSGQIKAHAMYASQRYIKEFLISMPTSVCSKSKQAPLKTVDLYFGSTDIQP